MKYPQFIIETESEETKSPKWIVFLDLTEPGALLLRKHYFIRLDSFTTEEEALDFIENVRNAGLTNEGDWTTSGKKRE